jgi:hypothetical protein
MVEDFTAQVCLDLANAQCNGALHSGIGSWPGSAGKPGKGALGSWSMLPGHCGKSISDDLSVDECGVEQCRYEVLILLAKGAELCGTQVLLVQAPPGELRLPGGRGGVRVLNLD